MTVWFTSHTRPKVVVREMFDQSVVDIAWYVVSLLSIPSISISFQDLKVLEPYIHYRSREGQHLLMCSTDGTVAFLRLEGSLKPLSPADAADYLRSQYGDAVLTSATTSSAIIEDPALLGLSMNTTNTVSMTAQVRLLLCHTLGN